MSAAVMALYRVRTPLLLGSAVTILAGTLLSLVLPSGTVASVVSLLPLVGLVGMLAAFLVALPASRHLQVGEPVVVRSPVVGRWAALNSPATKVPSHGVRAYGQAYAIDLVHEPVDGARPEFGSGAAMRDVTEYPAFGQDVRAMVDGVVVTVHDRQRDHRARSSTAAVGYMMVEGMLRELGGPRFIVGNHVVVRSDDGVFAFVAHLQRGSVIVREGDRVRAGQRVGACGNSGNSSEPHVHAQLMDRRSAWTGQGVPLAFADVAVEGGGPGVGLPADGERMTVAQQAPSLDR
jgi:hypothetical protein